MSYSRNLSPGSRRLINPARASDSNVEAYQSQRHNSYVSPRSSGERVIPISTQTFVNIPASSSGSSRSTAYDSYSSRPRRSSLIDQGRSSRRANVVQGVEAVRPPSPPRTREVYLVPATTKEPKEKHRKVYSIDESGAKLVTDPERQTKARHHRRRDSEDRAYKDDRGRRAYPVSRKDKSIDDDDAFSYTDAAGMFRETQPSWRERDMRPRRGSLDRGASKERPVSMLDPYASDSRRKDGPPPSQRGWDKINDLGRTRSVREGPREVAQSPSRGRDSRHAEYQPRRNSLDRSKPPPAPQYDQYDSLDEYDYDQREPRLERNEAPRTKDRSVSRRGFGIRGDSTDRHAPRQSDESLDDGRRTAMREPDYAAARRGFGIMEDSQDRHAPRQSDENLDGTRRATIREAEAAESRRKDYDSDLDYRDDRRRPADRERRQRDYDDHDDRPRHRDDRRQKEHEDDYDDRPRYREDRRQKEQEDDSHRNSIADAGKLAAAGGLAGAALYGISKDRDRHDEDKLDAGQRIERRNSERREPERRSKPTFDAPYSSDREEDRGLGFAFEGPKSRPEQEQHKERQNFDRRPEPEPKERQHTDRDLERTHEDAPPVSMPTAIDPDEDYRRRMAQVQREFGLNAAPAHDVDPDRERRRREREARLHERNGDATAGAYPYSNSSTYDADAPESLVSSRPSELRRRPSIIDQPMPSEPTAQIIDNSMSEKRENRVRIVDPPTEEEDKRPKGILKKPTVKFPEDHNSVREGVAPLKDATKKGIPPGARWTKIDRRLVNPEALEEAKERYEERLDCVIVLRVLTKEEIQKLADRTRDLRDKRFENERKTTRRRDRERDRHERDEYSDDGLEDWERDEKRPIRMLEAAPSTDNNDRRDDRREREGSYVSSSRGGRE